MMNPESIIKKYYQDGSPLFWIITEHSKAVRDMAIEIAIKHSEFNADVQFIEQAAMLHDIGIFMTDAPGILCKGNMPYICHGYLGRELIEQEGFLKHALVCERHTGTGLTIKDIEGQCLPIPHREMVPVSIEEQIICFADKFFSKSGELTKPKPIDKIRRTLLKHGEFHIKKFDDWTKLFL